MQGTKYWALIAAITACGGRAESTHAGDVRGGAAGTSSRLEGGSYSTANGGDVGAALSALGGATTNERGGAAGSRQGIAGIAATAGSGAFAGTLGGLMVAAGVAGIGAIVGASGASSPCAGMAGTCPDGCASLPVLHRQGCGTEALHENICLSKAPTIEAPACGVKTASGEVYRLDFERPRITGPSPVIQNPFSSIAGFRACNQTEIDASNCWPAEEISTQKVSFLVANDSGADRYLAKSGSTCTPFGIERGPNWTSLLLGVDSPPWCPCSYSSCDGGSAATFVRLVPGASDSLEWDARELQTVEQLVSCSDTSDGHVLFGIPKRVGPGTYRVTVGYELDGSDWGMPRGPGAQPRCSTRNWLSQEFTLPDSGDLVVQLSLR